MDYSSLELKYQKVSILLHFSQSQRLKVWLNKCWVLKRMIIIYKTVGVSHTTASRQGE